ncbi:MAG: hypothetical protein FWD53_11260, partial [Phycisphaerales bacterium]|nr:hypothetical protein [Phycisphaerales bacterium]
MKRLNFWFGMSVLVIVVMAIAVGGWAADDSADPAFRTRFDRELVDGRPTLICTRVEKGPVIDGEVDKDPVWQRSSRTRGAWTQLATKEISGRQTVVYSCHDKDKLYFAFVCEEPELNSVRMDGSLMKPFQPSGDDDSVEVVIEIGGTQGDGEVYSFRANSRAKHAAWGASPIVPIVGNVGNHVPVWEAAGKFGPNRWMVEMAIPFETLKRRPERAGLLANGAPSRGYVIGLKLLRWCAQQDDARNRMVSTWNTDMVVVTPYVAGNNGLLYMEDANSLRDGDFGMIGRGAEQSPWRIGRRSTVQIGERGAHLMVGGSLEQRVAVQPKSFYLFSLTGEGMGALELLVDEKPVMLRDGQAGFWTGERQREVSVMLRVGKDEKASIKRVLMQYQPGEKTPGMYCLTNNYRHDRTIRSVLPDAPEGRYQYVALDYKNEIAGDENPAIRFTRHQGWAYDYNLRVEDLGGKAGWIPFGKGSLTSRPEAVFWQTANPGDPRCWGRA